MPTVKPLFQDEVQLAGWSESHTSGAKVTFWLHDPELLSAFRGMTERKGKTAGQRLAMVLVEIGDDDNPVEQPAPKEKPGPLCMLAVRWCKDKDFQEWACIPGGIDPSEDEARRHIMTVCGLARVGVKSSRRELDTNPEAADKFQRLIRRPYVAYLEGKK